jgi:hypothetical protein
MSHLIFKNVSTTKKEMSIHYNPHNHSDVLLLQDYFPAARYWSNEDPLPVASLARRAYTTSITSGHYHSSTMAVASKQYVWQQDSDRTGQR